MSQTSHTEMVSIIVIIIVLAVIAGLVVWYYNTHSTSSTPTRTASGALSTDPKNSELILLNPKLGGVITGISVMPSDQGILNSSGNPYILDVLDAINANSGGYTYRLANASDLNAANTAGFDLSREGWALTSSSLPSNLTSSYQGYGVTNGKAAVDWNPSACATGSTNPSNCCGTGTCENGVTLGMYIVGVKLPHGSLGEDPEVNVYDWNHPNNQWSFYSN